jgi:gamma-glutamyltranspeptidase/glutathione hydrolase
VPGVPAALGRALEQFGTWTLKQVLESAIRLARDGYRLEDDEAARFRAAADDLARYPGARGYFLKPDGSPYQPGEVFVQEDLARTLQTIAEDGIDAFYRGPIADAIHADMAASGGFITRSDLAGYQALPALLVRGEYRGHSLVSNFRPSAGHAVIEALHIMATFGPAPASESWEYASIAGQAMRMAISDRGRRFGDENQSAGKITSKEWAAERAGEIDPSGSVVGALAPRFEDEPTLVAQYVDNTTHLSVMDASGMVVAHTQSLGPSMGTRVATPGLGFLYATRLGTTPGSRPSSTIAPTILFSPDDTPLLAVGCAGNDRIITAVVQVISHIVDHGMSLEQAMAAPRVHPAGDKRLRLESGDVSIWPETVGPALQRAGFEVVAAPSRDFGRVHAVLFDPVTGLFTGVAEPRWDGAAAGPDGR